MHCACLKEEINIPGRICYKNNIEVFQELKECEKWD